MAVRGLSFWPHDYARERARRLLALGLHRRRHKTCFLSHGWKARLDYGPHVVEDVRSRVKGPVQIATDNIRAYPFHIRSAFGYEGYNYGTETKIFGEPMLPDGTLAQLGRNEGVPAA